jgi:hypothetical protein
MVFRGEYGRRSGHASLVSSTFTSQQSQCLLEQDPRGIASYLVAQRNGPARNHTCARLSIRDGPFTQDNQPRSVLPRSSYHRCLVHPTLQEDTSMRKRQEGCVHRTQARRQPACLPRVEFYPRQGGGHHGTEI